MSGCATGSVGGDLPRRPLLSIVVIGMAIATHHPVSQTKAVNDPDVVAKIDPQDYDVVADLDELIAWDENSVWEEKPTM